MKDNTRGINENYIGIDIGGTAIKSGIVNEKGKFFLVRLQKPFLIITKHHFGKQH